MSNSHHCFVCGAACIVLILKKKKYHLNAITQKIIKRIIQNGVRIKGIATSTLAVMQIDNFVLIVIALVLAKPLKCFL